jgi:hypothetical protein
MAAFRRALRELECQLMLRIVRRLPLCAQLSSLGEASGQVLDNPQGRKPVLMPISGVAALRGFERWQKLVKRRSSGLRDRSVWVACQGRSGSGRSGANGGGNIGSFCRTRPRAFVTASLRKMPPEKIDWTARYRSSCGHRSCREDSLVFSCDVIPVQEKTGMQSFLKFLWAASTRVQRRRIISCVRAG